MGEWVRGGEGGERSDFYTHSTLHIGFPQVNLWDDDTIKSMQTYRD